MPRFRQGDRLALDAVQELGIEDKERPTFGVRRLRVLTKEGALTTDARHADVQMYDRPYWSGA